MANENNGFQPNSNVTANSFNNGVKYADYDPFLNTNGDTPQASDFNNIIEALLFLQGLAKNPPDNTDVDNVGTPNVELITATDGTAKLKFSNLKGSQGESGADGVGISSIETVGVTHSNGYNYTNIRIYYTNGTNLQFVIPAKDGEKGTTGASVQSISVTKIS